MLTGHYALFEEEDAWLKGAYAYVLKPCPIIKLVALIEAAGSNVDTGPVTPQMVFDHKAICGGFQKQYPFGHEIGGPAPGPVTTRPALSERNNTHFHAKRQAMADTELQQPAKLLRTETSPHRLWRGLLLFLEIIGLRREEQNVSQAEQLARLRLYHTEFRKLIAANHSFLETLGDLEEKRSGHHYLDRSFVKRKAARALMDVHAMVESINVISGDRYPSLRQAFERIAGTLTESMEDQPEHYASELVLELPDISGIKVNVVGGKNL